MQTSEAAAIHRSRVLSRGRDFDPAIRRRIESGLFIPAEAYLHAQQVRAKLRKVALRTLDEVDLLATPTTAIAAPRLEQERVTMQGQDVPVREALLTYHAHIQHGGAACHIRAMWVHRRTGCLLACNWWASRSRRDSCCAWRMPTRSRRPGALLVRRCDGTTAR